MIKIEFLPLYFIMCLISITLFVGLYLHGNFVQENRKREVLITECEFYLADVWAEKEDYKRQLGIFRVKPKDEATN